MRRMPPCFGSAANATAEEAASKHTATAASARTLRIFSLRRRFRPQNGPINRTIAMAGRLRNQQRPKSILVLWRNALGPDDVEGGSIGRLNAMEAGTGNVG